MMKQNIVIKPTYIGKGSQRSTKLWDVLNSHWASVVDFDLYDTRTQERDEFGLMMSQVDGVENLVPRFPIFSILRPFTTKLHK